MALSQMGSMGGLKTRLSLRFKCNNLPNLDKGSKTDAFIVLYLDKGSQGLFKLGQTELIADNLDPEFVTSITVDYYFEEQQNMILEVYDADDASNLMNLSLQ